jgi:predicted MFS family arabinose efflux permease
MILIIVGCFIYQFVSLIGVLILIRVIHGIGYSASTNATGTIVADVLPKEKRTQGIGYYGFVTAASLALGPATGLMVMNHFGIKSAFSLAGFLAIIGLLASIFIDYEFEVKSNETQKTNKLNLAYEKTSLPAAVVMLFVAFAYSGIMTFLPVYAVSLGIHNISLFFMVYAGFLLVTRLIVDKITKKRDISLVLIPGILLMIVTFVILAVSTSINWFLVAAVFFAIGYGTILPSLNAIVISLCAPHKRGAANSTFFSSLDLGIGLGAFVWGIISKIYGYPMIYWGCIAFMAFAILAVFLFKNKLRSSK